MTVADRFRAFYAAANDGDEPYPWQVALAQRLAETGAWPAAIGAPTGAGKSSVVDVHVFVVAERARQVAHGAEPTVARPPRRLVLVAPRRVLVDDQHERAVRLAAAIEKANDSGSVLDEVRETLATLTTTAAGIAAPPLGVTRLRGGALIDMSWRLDPAQCQIVCATPQMWGSRLLMRGFRSSRRVRNLETGLLAHDVVVVIDEAHLHQRLVQTARRVAASDRGTGALHVVAMSATHAAEEAHTLGDADFACEPLARRVCAAKAVQLHRVEDWQRQAGEQLASIALEARRAAPGAGTIGVFTNTVERALDVANRLADEGQTRVVCGRMRPADVARLRTECPGLLDAGGNREVAFLVATQSLEVGVDLDLPEIVSEIAPPAALAQRLGRLNRSGSRDASRFHVVAPVELPTDGRAQLGPYAVEEVATAFGWLASLHGDASPARIAESDLPLAVRAPVPAITGVDLETLAMTSPDLAADPDVAFYIEDSTGSDRREVQVGARAHLDLDEETVRSTLLVAPPRAHELATVTLTSGRGGLVARLLDASPVAWALRQSGGSATALPVTRADELLGGDTLLLSAGSRVMTLGVLGVPPSGTGQPCDEVIDERPDGPSDAVLCIEGDHANDVGALAAADPVLGTRSARGRLADIVAAAGYEDVARRLRQHRYLGELVVNWAREGDGPGLLAVVATGRGGAGFERAVSTRLTTLDEHAAGVEARMARILAALDGVADDGRDALTVAARLHDEGKRHPRFQQRMGAQHGDPPLAKPRPGHAPDRGDRWRHEQYSAAVAWARGHGPLVTTLIAAHHGRGRPLFDRDDSALLGPWEGAPPDEIAALRELYGPAGIYEALRDEQQRSLGPHALAYLEALLRCADMQVSSEVTT